jgi:hypothetical protein
VAAVLPLLVLPLPRVLRKALWRLLLVLLMLRLLLLP